MSRQIQRNRRFANASNTLWSDDDGSMTIFACFMVVIMLMIGGIGVDLMHHEMERTRLQAVADRAVLAAADLDQRLDPKAVVEDYFEKSSISEYVSNISVVRNDGFRRVKVEATTKMHTRFLGMMGVDTLTVPAVSEAMERAVKVEISLALDITTSMVAGSRLADLKPAATAFIDTVLADNNGTLTSVSLIPYGGQVNAGPVMFDHIGAVRNPPTPLDQTDGGVPEHESHGILPALDANGEPIRGGVGTDPNDNTRYVWPNKSSCPDIQADSFSNVSLPHHEAYAQTPYFSVWNDRKTDVKDVGWCPKDEAQIQYLSRDRNQLNDTIDRMRLYDGTGTQYAMKWALALLDPSSSNTLSALSTDLKISSEFAQRPAPYTDNDTQKYIILMTDGDISHQYRPKEVFGETNAKRRIPSRSPRLYVETSSGSAYAQFQEVCDLAKAQGPVPITIFTIAFETRGRKQVNAMRNCASSPSHFFTSDGADIAQTFQSIARQIEQLKLTR